MAKADDSRPTWLLLLPCPPSDISMSTLKVAYGPCLSALLEQASEVSLNSQNVVLDIAIAYERDSDYGYSTLQSLFGLLYRLICVICVDQRIDLDYDNDVDARLMLFRDMQDDDEHQSLGALDRQTMEKRFIDLAALAGTERAWQRICSLKGEIPEKLLQNFLGHRHKSSHSAMSEAQVERFPGGLLVRHERSQGLLLHDKSFSQHGSVAVGGTFDHLHAGHKLLLTMAALVLNLQSLEGPHLTVGITGDELLKKKQYREELEDFWERQLTVQKFLLGILELISPKQVLISTQTVQRSGSSGREIENKLGSGLIITYAEIFDPCGPTVTDKAISALILSAETRNGGHVVNAKREKQGWPALEVFEVEVLDAREDETSRADAEFQSKISSTDIRRKVHQKSVTNNNRKSYRNSEG